MALPYDGALDITSPLAFIRANFSNASSSTTPIPLYKERLGIDAFVIRSGSGQLLLAITPMPPSSARVRVLWDDGEIGAPHYSWFDIATTNFVAGTALVPDQQAVEIGGSYSGPFAQVIDTNGEAGQPVTIRSGFDSSDTWWPTQLTFIDGRPHLKENLKFLIRSATVSTRFSYSSNFGLDPSQYPDADPSWIGSPEYIFARPPSPESYEHYGFRFFGTEHGPVLHPLRPIQENHLWRNFAYSSCDFSNTTFITGGSYDSLSHVRKLRNAKYAYTGTGTESPLPILLSDGGFPWLLFRGYATFPTFDTVAAAEIGVISNTTHSALVTTDARNSFGLPLESLRVGPSTLVSPGSTFVTTNSLSFPDFEAPSLQTVDYYFSSQVPHYQAFDLHHPAVPGSSDFTTTNTTPLLIASVGQTYEVSGWAKQAILNGYSDKFAYLEQYFDKAYKLDTNGLATTNETGVLSPYGEFFPTEPGPAALVTMPDIETGERGTGVVNVIKLQLDVNHDGVMDLTFGGPDNTSASHPFRFWVNNDFDAAGLYGDPDHDVNAANFPDYSYSDTIYGNGKPCIRSKRDLEDYARLWISGMPGLTNSGYQVTLGWGSIGSGNPIIHLFQSVETNGGTLYLTDTNVALAQTVVQGFVTNATYIPGPGVSIGTVSQGAAFTFPTSYFGDGATKHLLFEGAGVGSGELVITVQQGTNVLGKASAWLDLREVKDMFEQAHADDVSLADPPTTNSGRFKTDNSPVTGSEDQQVIIFVHGINNTEFDFENTSQTMFKRLYWQGYHGRFASFRWRSPTWSLIPISNDQISYLNFNKGEYIAYQSAAALKGILIPQKQIPRRHR